MNQEFQTLFPLVIISSDKGSRFLMGPSWPYDVCLKRVNFLRLIGDASSWFLSLPLCRWGNRDLKKLKNWSNVIEMWHNLGMNHN